MLTLLRSLTFLDYVALLAAALLLSALIALVVGLIRRTGGAAERFVWPIVMGVVALIVIGGVGPDRTLGVVDPLLRAIFAGNLA